MLHAVLAIVVPEMSAVCLVFQPMVPLADAALGGVDADDDVLAACHVVQALFSQKPPASLQYYLLQQTRALVQTVWLL